MQRQRSAYIRKANHLTSVGLGEWKALLCTSCMPRPLTIEIESCRQRQNSVASTVAHSPQYDSPQLASDARDNVDARPLIGEFLKHHPPKVTPRVKGRRVSSVSPSAIRVKPENLSPEERD